MNVLLKLALAVGWVWLAFLAASFVVIAAGSVFGLGLLVYELVR